MSKISIIRKKLRGHKVLTVVPKGMTRRSACIHEAGHAVLAISLRCTVSAAHVSAEGHPVDGWCLADGHAMSYDSRMCAMYSVAGVVAQRVTWIGVIDANMFVAAHDLDMNLDMKNLGKSFIATKKIVRKYIAPFRPAIVAIANYLYKNGTIHRKQIEKLAFKACPDLIAMRPPKRIGMTEAAWNLACAVRRFGLTSLPSM